MVITKVLVIEKVFVQCTNVEGTCP